MSHGRVFYRRDPGKLRWLDSNKGGGRACRDSNSRRAGDASVFARLAADDIAVMPPNAGLVLGREANVNATRDFFGKFTLRVDYTRSVVEVRGETAIDRGVYSQTLTPKNGGPPSSSRGCYLWVYRRSAAGGWELSHAIWNLD